VDTPDAVLFREARATRGETIVGAAEGAGVAHSVITHVERFGVYDGMRVKDFLKLVSYYGLDREYLFGLLGFGTTERQPSALDPLFSAVLALDDTQQAFVVEHLSVLLRGLHR
jgi:hypothetical protein